MEFALLLSFPSFLRFLRESDSELNDIYIYIYIFRSNKSEPTQTSSLATKRRFELVLLTFLLNQASGASRGMANFLLHVFYVATGRRALSQLLLLHAWYLNVLRTIGVSRIAFKDGFRHGSISQKLDGIFIFKIYRSEDGRSTVSICVYWS